MLRSEEASQSPFLRKAASVLKRNALAQSQLITDLLDLSRLQSGELSLNCETVTFATVLSDAVETIRAEATSRNIRLEVDISDKAIAVAGDPLRLEQVVWNLLNNAMKFTPDGGRV